MGIPILKKEKKSKNEKKKRTAKERKSNAYAPPSYK